VRRKSRRLIPVSLAIATTGGIAVGAVALHFSAERTPTPRPARSTAPVDPFAELRVRPLRLPARRRRGDCALRPQLSPATELPGIPVEAGLGDGPIYVAFPAIPRVLDLFPPESESALRKGKWRSAETVLVSDPAYDGPFSSAGGSSTA
jgi:hypothetical protein